MLEAIFWGLVQGLTEFLPISSSGHLVLIPALFGIDEPSLATTAVLHIGTLLAVVVYFRSDLKQLILFRTPEARRVLLLLAVGTAPAVLGLLLVDPVERIQASTVAVALLLILNGAILYAAGWLPRGSRHLTDGKPIDALAVGAAQIAAVFPGISRSGMTISAGQARGFDGKQAARFSFLLSIPVIAAAGTVQGVELAREGGLTSGVWAGVAVAAVSGYLAIALVLRVINRTGLRPFAYYCWALGVLSLIAI